MSVPTSAVSTSLQQMQAPNSPPAGTLVRMGFETSAGFELMQRGANALSKSTLVPQQFQNNLPNCMIALNMATRLGADPLLVMQNLYVVHGRPGWSAQFLIATFNQCGRFSAMRYRWFGTPGQNDYGCQAYATELESKEKIEGPRITIALAIAEGWYNKNGSKWKTMPELMLMYRAAAWLVRTHAPEISMGLQTAEELGDIYDAKAGTDGTYRVTPEQLRTGAESLVESTDRFVRGADGEIRTPPDAVDAEVEPVSESPPADDRPAPPKQEDAIASIRGQLSADALRGTWALLVKQYSEAGAAVPVDVEAAFNDRREALTATGTETTATRTRRS